MNSVVQISAAAGQGETRRFPWFTFVFLTACFFIALHDPTRSFSIQGDYLPSGDTLEKHAADGNVKRQIGFLGAGAFGFLVMVGARRKSLQVNGTLALLVFFLLTWILLSVTWADERTLSARRLVVIATLCFGAIAVACSLTPREIMLFVLFSSMVYLVAGITSEIAIGTFTPTAERYRFSGTLHPNNQGVNCSLILLASITALHTEKRFKSLFIACAGLAFLFLVLTKSRTSLLAFLVTFAVYSVLVYGRSRHFAYICTLATTAVLIVLFVASDAVAPALERSLLMGRTDQDISGTMSLTGRLPLWQDLIEYAAVRPFQGYGYGSFFTVEHIREISDRQGWPIAECHSVFLEVLLGLGVIGLIAYSLIQFIGIAVAARYFRVTLDPHFAFLGGLLVLGVIGGFSESTLLVPTMQTFVQFITLGYFGFVAGPPLVEAFASSRDRRRFSAPALRRPTAMPRGHA
ncbi:MAG TPA: O-antigen ligase family protein [Candidatus Hydrogenedentes bacterium]|nr:O-antigen ligase family protein [Candidatus Hydrogenedentota bacterium]HRK33105.1 O-antigen ligase family protein [Candidatus Hydrogenedentota bacterium]